jgi:hypothetical protein
MIWLPLDVCPYDMPVVFLFPDNIIHSGCKCLQSWVSRQGFPDETHGVRDDYVPIGIRSTYDSDPYFSKDPIGWMHANLVIRNGLETD